MSVKEFNRYCVNNDCYKNNAKLASVEYLVVHTPAVYPVIIRGESGSGGGWCKRWNKPGVEKLTHGVIDDVGVYNFAPETMTCWQVGNAWGNSHCIGYEFCELNTKEEFNKVWDNGVEKYAELCKKYKLSVDRIVGHCEAHDKGFASNHSDPEPYFRRFGKSVKDFRNDVDKILKGNVASTSTDKRSVSGTIVVLKDVNIRNAYSFADSAVIGKAYAGEQHQVVESKMVEGTLMYKTATGKYITGASSYVKFQNGVDTRLTYSTHIQTYGNLSFVANGCVAGTIGESKRLEAITINCGVPIQYRAHIQSYGWQAWKTNGQVAGTNGEAKRLEAIQIKRTDGRNIKYRVHMQGIGWGDWVSNGAIAGTTGQSRRIEAIQIILE